MSATAPAVASVTAQQANATNALNQTEWPVSGDKTLWARAIPLGPAFREARDVTHGPAATGGLGVLWGSTDDWRNRDAVAHPSRRIVAVGMADPRYQDFSITHTESGQVETWLSAD